MQRDIKEITLELHGYNRHEEFKPWGHLIFCVYDNVEDAVHE